MGLGIVPPRGLLSRTRVMGDGFGWLGLGVFYSPIPSPPATATAWSFSTVLPLTPIAPTTSPLEFFRGTPPGKVIKPSLLCSIPYKGPPGCESFPISPVFMSNQRAVRALRIEMSMLPSHAPSMRANAFRLPPASTTAISMRVLSCAAFFLAAPTIVSDASNVRSSAIRHLARESGQTFFLSWWRKSRSMCRTWFVTVCGRSEPLGWDRVVRGWGWYYVIHCAHGLRHQSFVGGRLSPGGCRGWGTPGGEGSR